MMLVRFGGALTQSELMSNRRSLCLLFVIVSMKTQENGNRIDREPLSLRIDFTTDSMR